MSPQTQPQTTGQTTGQLSGNFKKSGFPYNPFRKKKDNLKVNLGKKKNHKKTRIRNNALKNPITTGVFSIIIRESRRKKIQKKKRSVLRGLVLCLILIHQESFFVVLLTCKDNNLRLFVGATT